MMKISKRISLKKITSLFLISLLVVVGTAGCNIGRGPTPSETPDEKIEDKEDKTVEAKNTVDEKLKDKIKIVEEGSIPNDAKEWLGQFEQAEGAYVFQHPDATYVKINSKEQPTGGYSIHIKDYSDEEYNREIIYEIVEPGKDVMVTQAITYPSVILEIHSDMVAQYEVKTSKGEVLKTEEKVILAKLDLPKENEEISNPVKIKGKIVAFEAAFSVRILDDKDNIIHEEHLMADAGGPNWGNFDAEITYPKPNSETGSIEIGEYSAKDGEFELREKVAIKFSK